MPVQRFTCKNEGDGYTVLAVCEDNKTFYAFERHEQPVDAVLVSGEIFDIIKRGIIERGYKAKGGDKITIMNDKYVASILYCIATDNVDVNDIMRTIGTDFKGAAEIISWMERMGYIVAESGYKYKVCMNLGEFIAKYGNLEF